MASITAQYGIKVGDFFVRSWGYDQTNINFYKVTKVTPAGVRVQPWSQQLVGEGGGPQERVAPGDKPAQVVDWSKVRPNVDYFGRQADILEATSDAPDEFHRIAKGYSRATFTVNSYSSAHAWDGTPQYQTGAGWGH